MAGIRSVGVSGRGTMGASMAIVAARARRQAAREARISRPLETADDDLPGRG